MSSILRGVYTTEQKWHGSDKNWNDSNSFCKETVKFYPFRLGSTGAYGPVTERIKLHCFFAKTIGTVPVFVGSVPFLLCRVNAPLKPPLGLRKHMDTTHSPQSSLVNECQNLTNPPPHGQNWCKKKQQSIDRCIRTLQGTALYKANASNMADSHLVPDLLFSM